MFGPCSIVEREKEGVISIRTVTPFEQLSDLIGQCYGKIYQYMLEVGAVPSGPPFVAYFNMDMKALDVEIGFPTDREVADRDDIKMSALPAGKFATMIYTGSYGGLKDAYGELSKWMEDKQQKPNYACFEIYLNDPATVKAEALETQIFLGVE